MKTYRVLRDCIYPVPGQRKRWFKDDTVIVEDNVVLPHHFMLDSDDAKQIKEVVVPMANTFSGIQQQQKAIAYQG